jgi:hypothetical protein
MNSKERIVFDLAMVTIFIATVWTSIELQWGVGVGIWIGGILSATLLLLYDLTSNWSDN